MRVLYADPSCFKEHVSFNKNNLRVLCKQCKVSTYFIKDYFNLDEFEIEKSYESELKCFPQLIEHKNKIDYFIRTKIGQIRITREILKIAEDGKFDLVIFSCVDITAFSFATCRTKLSLAFYEHGLYLTTKKRWKWVRFFWRHLNKRVKVIILEEYFSPYIRNELKCKNKQFLIRHPLGHIENNQRLLLESNKKIIFAPSKGNDQFFIDELIEKDELIPPNYLIVARGNKTHNSDNLIVYSDFLSREEYEEYSLGSEYILIAYPDDYVFRTSGVIFESVACKKEILLLKGNTLENYKTLYPSIFHLFNDADGFLELLNTIERNDNKSEKENDFHHFLLDYSDEQLKQSFRDLFDDKGYLNE